jgi:hypothetical protein
VGAGAIRAEDDSPRGVKAASRPRLAVTDYKRSKTAYERFERLSNAVALVFALVTLLILALWLLSGP